MFGINSWANGGFGGFQFDPWVDQVGFFGGGWSPFTSGISSSYIGDGFFAFPNFSSFFGGGYNPFAGPLAFAASLAGSFQMPGFFGSPSARYGYGYPNGYAPSAQPAAAAPAQAAAPQPAANPNKAEPQGNADWDAPAATEPNKSNDTPTPQAEPAKDVKAEAKKGNEKNVAGQRAQVASKGTPGKGEKTKKQPKESHKSYLDVTQTCFEGNIVTRASGLGIRATPDNANCTIMLSKDGARDPKPEDFDYIRRKAKEQGYH